MKKPKPYQYDGLTDRDLDNLNFLVNASDEVLQGWMNYVDDDDLEYAQELLVMLFLVENFYNNMGVKSERTN